MPGGRLALLGAGLEVSSAGGGTPTIVQSVVNTQNSHSGGSCTWGTATTAGSLLILIAVNSISDTGTNPAGWTLDRSGSDGGVERGRILSIPNASSQSGTVNIGSLNGDWITALLEISGLHNGGIVDVGNSHGAVGTSCTTGSITTTDVNDFIIAVFFAGFNLVDGVTGSFTEMFSGIKTQPNQQTIIAQRIPGATITVNPSATLSGSNNNAGMIQAYKGN